jgi:hypothetical protein
VGRTTCYALGTGATRLLDALAFAEYYVSGLPGGGKRDRRLSGEELKHVEAALITTANQTMMVDSVVGDGVLKKKLKAYKSAGKAIAEKVKAVSAATPSGKRVKAEALAFLPGELKKLKAKADELSQLSREACENWRTP